MKQTIIVKIGWDDLSKAMQKEIMVTLRTRNASRLFIDGQIVMAVEPEKEYRESVEPIDPLEIYRKEALIAACELFYSETVQRKIQSAQSESEICHIMQQARIDTFEKYEKLRAIAAITNRISDEH